MEILSLQSFLFLLPLSIYLYLRFQITNSKKTIHKGFKQYPILGTLPQFLKHRNRFLDWTTEILADCPTNTAVIRRPGNVRGVITANPSNVAHILKNNCENYPKGERFLSLIQDFIGAGIFVSDGEQWKSQRKSASYAFNTKSLRNFVMENVRVEIQTRLMPILAEASETGCRLDLQDILERFAFDNVCKLAFNVDPACLGGEAKTGAEFMKAFDDATTLIFGRFLYVFKTTLSLKKFFNVGSERRLRESIQTVHNFADDIIMSRLKRSSEEEEVDDLLSLFMGNENNNSTEYLRDIVISLVLAGRDTTSSALSWFFWILSSRPLVQSNILKELETIRNRNGKTMGDIYDFEDLRDMHYLHAAISEAMRLYPPVPMDTRACLNDDVLADGTVVKKGWFVTYSTYAMGRMETIWGKDCGQYLPERWLSDEGTCRQESPFRFPVFNAGPRTCLGKELAYIQMKSIAASVMERYEIDVESKETCPVAQLSMTMRIKDGLPVILRKRCISV